MTKRCRIPVLSVDRIEVGEYGHWGYVAQADGLVEYGRTRKDAALRLRQHINRYALRERRAQAEVRRELHALADAAGAGREEVRSC